jgi:hypothetical protein
VIEPLLEAERMLSFGLIDQAERLYRQVATHDPKSSIAVVGLARVALERGDERTAYVEARHALAIDPDNPAAQHLVMRLTEVMEGRGETPPGVEDMKVEAAPGADPVATVGDAVGTAPPASATPPADLPAPARPPARPKPARKPRTLVDRLLGRRR